MTTPSGLPTEGWVYVVGADRNNPHECKSHIYTGPSHSDLRGPLCGYGWNRSDGEAFSILRNNSSSRGTCATCAKREKEGAGPVPPWPHKTRWI